MAMSNEESNLQNVLGDAIAITKESDIQNEIIQKADALLKSKQIENTQKQLNKLDHQRFELEKKLKSLKNRYATHGSSASKQDLADRIQEIQKQIKEIQENRDFVSQLTNDQESIGMQESEREKLIRTGMITPFDKEFELYSDSKDVEQEEEEVEEFHANRQDRYLDDGDESSYQRRLLAWATQRHEKRMSIQSHNQHGQAQDTEAEEFNLQTEMYTPGLVHNDVNYGPQFNLPGEIHHRLFKYQRTCIKWLWELYSQQVGGCLGDEMGLGKTIQIISFIAGLDYSQLLKNPVLIVCPATVMKQWVQEFHEWWPPLRIVVLHSSGSGISNTLYKSNSQSDNIDWDSSDQEPHDKVTKSNPNIKKLIELVVQKGHVLVTTYEGLRGYQTDLQSVEWGYVVLDEGHKIRNPDASITLAAKRLKTPHRMILSGTPIQNNLVELWSLYDFVFPGRLGTLPVFQSQFAIPISLGGYANASVFQVQTAYKCATVLRDLISPYLLRRMKSDVASSLPKKSEQVLFCKLTTKQRQEYLAFINSEDVGSILQGKRHSLYGIDILRKICNHPDLLYKNKEAIQDFGNPSRSGKLQVASALLSMWKSQGHKVLLFCQTRQMQDILEILVSSQGYSFLRMDGTTPIKDRSQLVDKYNDSSDIFVFLLTTKVGGLGINLTGANRIILYDPDWNPASDAQARERAWRLGQKRDVTIYRIMLSGTIEEKIYHRQIYKEFLSKKILQDPRQRRFFKSNELHDLFTLGEHSDSITETGQLFGSEVQIKRSTQESNESQTTCKKRRVRVDEELQDLQNVANNLDKVEEYQEPNQAQTKMDEESRILNELFSSTGVHSALHHDAIVGASRPESVIVEKEATRIAKEASAALRLSRKSVRKQKNFTPTWTGKSGSAGAPKRPPAFGLQRPSFGVKQPSTFPLQVSPSASSQILSKLAHKNQESNASAPQFIQQLLDYISLQPMQRATSSDLVNHFRPQIEKEGIPLFRKLLREIADFRKNEDQEQGIWVLKSDYFE